MRRRHPQTILGILASLLLVSAGCGTGGLSGEADLGSGSGGGSGGGSMDWAVRVVDANANAGSQNVLRIDPLGRPRIAYFAGVGTSFWIREASFDGWT